ncbi:putative galactosylxylosylprotein 3-beta-galactosyltransferase [Helianthus annuus]|uniref:Galactosylxylosylprotein 3-beta-galactosyltransferase n=1 Tax=Helianthus annuus TaxID=4232 RepID=A0A251TR83_HELAN|nr:hydroxyproline O-galactosyltransferase GALT3 [Helianthus annuus]KAF5818838.1 putative galactosylxylosylprotein 3-beta-galactosyltransferase [Helianthus annuus]KAJ0605062.1 putative galactosylxylosylprotein 3-beta-galactosyltransferase [Helianthus annuus]KAJ0777528.1 putative galactosylxylosylprotein 3-beta-galactosyltransferase [Helianthus annuus]
MKKWTGGVLIIGLTCVLLFSYSFIQQKQPQKQSAYQFFHPDDDKIANFSKPVGEKLETLTIKPHLVDVDGLDYLFNSTHTLKREELKPLLAWGQMRLLLSRSDSLPETAQGIKEAAAAWKVLKSEIDETRVSKFDHSTMDKNCSFSVSAVNGSSLVASNDTVILAIPCGLIVDSSVTLIAIPDGNQDGFQIEFVGSQGKDETDPPVVLHYNVVLPGDNFTKEPVIVQNTWTYESGWGKEERCPNHGSSNNVKVDGLVKCNEQLTRTSTEEKSNVSDHNHMGSNFPFSDGSLFAATIWAGKEGFYATINGRHETSFAYREKLEPWLVSGVRVKGGLRIISTLATGLPVSEDIDMVMNVESLKAPLIPKQSKRLLLLIGVFSSGNNFKRRMALRRSWMQYDAVRSGVVAVRFFIGLHKNKQVNYELWKEAQAYEDVQLMPFVDYYSLLTLKTIAICIMGTKILPAKYIMKTDDDAFVRVDEILASLKTKNPDGLLYGQVSLDSKPQRDKDNKWYISTEEWPEDSYPPWAHGPGYVISRDIAKFIVQGHQQRNLKLFKLEDVAVGIWIQQFKKQIREVQYVNDERFHNSGCEPNYILAHYQNPRMVLCLWEKLQKEHKPDCCD